MAEKMYSFTHSIGETALLALISQHATDVRIDITEALPKKGQRKNGIPLAALAAPLMLAGPQKAGQGPSPQALKPMRAGKNGKSTGHLTLEYLAQHMDRIVTMPELEANAVKHHKNKHSVSVAISVFLKKGWIERVDKGQYKILQEGVARVGGASTPPPRKGIKQPGVGTGNYDRGESTGTTLIWAELVKGEPVKSKPLRAAYADQGLTASSVSSAFASFVKRGLVSRVSNGVFKITKKGIELHAQQNAAT